MNIEIERHECVAQFPDAFHLLTSLFYSLTVCTGNTDSGTSLFVSLK